ncbi:hypothetical protein H696_01358 [Fonticula alba]|uniref:Integral membrane bound transporter domain-containing protein n=1 Tax=Fonticula alba TaxID=691883 RepID=A0A058ZC15_FONAL|nr:hypothetical protein H696_01358 [Fonticula alba]KCV71949.1 hypothetical protein H696_01358 [Fonticula alba]|eukprot:XP_009493527.1 hypothetical protein H696_01358 [Fonticula alba]
MESHPPEGSLCSASSASLRLVEVPAVDRSPAPPPGATPASESDDEAPTTPDTHEEAVDAPLQPAGPMPGGLSVLSLPGAEEDRRSLLGDPLVAATAASHRATFLSGSPRTVATGQGIPQMQSLLEAEAASSPLDAAEGHARASFESTLPRHPSESVWLGVVSASRLHRQPEPDPSGNLTPPDSPSADTLQLNAQDDPLGVNLGFGNMANDFSLAEDDFAMPARRSEASALTAAGRPSQASQYTAASIYARSMATAAGADPDSESDPGSQAAPLASCPRWPPVQRLISQWSWFFSWNRLFRASKETFAYMGVSLFCLIDPISDFMGTYSYLAPIMTLFTLSSDSFGRNLRFFFLANLGNAVGYSFGAIALLTNHPAPKIVLLFLGLFSFTLFKTIRPELWAIGHVMSINMLVIVSQRGPTSAALKNAFDLFKPNIFVLIFILLLSFLLFPRWGSRDSETDIAEVLRCVDQSLQLSVIDFIAATENASGDAVPNGSPPGGPLAFDACPHCRLPASICSLSPCSALTDSTHEEPICQQCYTLLFYTLASQEPIIPAPPVCLLREARASPRRRPLIRPAASQRPPAPLPARHRRSAGKHRPAHRRRSLAPVLPTRLALLQAIQQSTRPQAPTPGDPTLEEHRKRHLAQLGATRSSITQLGARQIEAEWEFGRVFWHYDRYRQIGDILHQMVRLVGAMGCTVHTPPPPAGPTAPGPVPRPMPTLLPELPSLDILRAGGSTLPLTSKHIVTTATLATGRCRSCNRPVAVQPQAMRTGPGAPARGYPLQSTLRHPLALGGGTHRAAPATANMPAIPGLARPRPAGLLSALPPAPTGQTDVDAIQQYLLLMKDAVILGQRRFSTYVQELAEFSMKNSSSRAFWWVRWWWPTGPRRILKGDEPFDTFIIEDLTRVVRDLETFERDAIRGINPAVDITKLHYKIFNMRELLIGLISLFALTNATCIERTSLWRNLWRLFVNTFIVSSSQSKLRRQVVTSSSTLSSTAHAGVVGGLYTSSLPDPGRLQDAKYLESQRILREAEAISHSPGHRARSAFMRLRLRTWQLHDIITRSINVRFALKISGTLTLLVVPTIVDSTATVWSYWSVLWSAMTVLLVSQPSFGGFFPHALYRIIGTVAAAAWAIIMDVAFGQSFWATTGMLIPLIFVGQYIRLLPSSASGLGVQIIGAAFPIILAFYKRPYNPPVYTNIYEIAYKRGVALILGLIIAILIHRLIWPYLARVVLERKLAAVFATQGVIFSRLQSAITTFNPALLAERHLLASDKSRAAKAVGHAAAHQRDIADASTDVFNEVLRHMSFSSPPRLPLMDTSAVVTAVAARSRAGSRAGSRPSSTSDIELESLGPWASNTAQRSDPPSPASDAGPAPPGPGSGDKSPPEPSNALPALKGHSRLDLEKGKQHASLFGHPLRALDAAVKKRDRLYVRIQVTLQQCRALHTIALNEPRWMGKWDGPRYNSLILGCASLLEQISSLRVIARRVEAARIACSGQFHRYVRRVLTPGQLDTLRGDPRLGAWLARQYVLFDPLSPVTAALASPTGQRATSSILLGYHILSITVRGKLALPYNFPDCLGSIDQLICRLRQATEEVLARDRQTRAESRWAPAAGLIPPTGFPFPPPKLPASLSSCSLLSLPPNYNSTGGSGTSPTGADEAGSSLGSGGHSPISLESLPRSALPTIESAYALLCPRDLEERLMLIFAFTFTIRSIALKMAEMEDILRALFGTTHAPSRSLLD